MHLTPAGNHIAACALAIAFVLIGPALIGPTLAGTLDHGNWLPTRCGVEPTPPSGLNLSSADAYKESIKWINAYQDEYNKYSDCMVKEANEDSNAINDYVHGTQKKAQDFFDKASADSKRAQSVLSGGSNSSGSGNHHGVGISSQGGQ